MRDFDNDMDFTGLGFQFDIKDVAPEYPDLAKFHGMYGVIDSLEVGTGKNIEDSYWNVRMNDGTLLSGISGYHIKIF